MRKKYLSALLFGALLFASAGTFTSCKDYDDDINNLSQRVDQIASDLADLETKVNALGCVESIEFSDGKLIVHTPNGDVSAAMPECTGIKEVKLEGNTLYVDGVEAGKVELGSGEEGQIPVITVKDGKLYVNDQLMDIEVGSNVVLVDNGDTCTITVDGQSVTLMKNAAQLTSIVIENLDEAQFTGVNGGAIVWDLATKATPNWAGEKGAVALNQLLIGQISTVNVQVTPADYDLGAQQLTLVDSRGNVAPVIVTAEANNRLMKSRTASTNGSWTLSIAIDQTKVNEGNIGQAFLYDPQDSSKGQMAYTLCVNGKPYTTYDLSVGLIAEITTGKIYASSSSLTFIDADGREQNAANEKIPVGTTELIFEKVDLYDYYYTFEGTNKSLAEQYGITISEDGKSIIVPEGAEGVIINVTVHTMSVSGDVYPNAGDPATANTVRLQIAGTEIEAQTLATTTHQVKPGDALKEIRVDFKTADGENVFSKFPAANREAARTRGQFKVIEDNTQTGFFINSSPNADNESELNTSVRYYKADNTFWTSSDDLLDLSYMLLDPANVVAPDAKPGNYNLTFVVEDDNSVTTVSGNELIKVTIPVAITVPTFDELFTKDANWNEAKDTYTARIFIDDQAAKLRYTDAFASTGDFDVETSHINLTFNALDEYNNYPIFGGTEYVTDNSQAVATPISSDIELNKANVYNDDLNALEVDKLTGMHAYYNVFDGESQSSMGIWNWDAYQAVLQAFTIASGEFTTQIQTALHGIEVAYYIDNVEQTNVVMDLSGSIAPGRGDGSNGNKWNGLFFILNDNKFEVRATNFGSSAADKLDDTYTLYEAFGVPATQPRFNNVNVSFVDNNGGTFTWNMSDDCLQLSTSADATTVKITFKDATGIEYKKEVKVQQAR